MSCSLVTVVEYDPIEIIKSVNEIVWYLNFNINYIVFFVANSRFSQTYGMACEFY